MAQPCPSPLSRFHAVRAPLLCLVLALPFGCSDDEDGARTPAQLCSAACERNRCSGDPSVGQCQSGCENWYDRCPEQARNFHECFTSIPNAELICDDDDRTHLAMGLCDTEENAFIFCLRQ